MTLFSFISSRDKKSEKKIMIIQFYNASSTFWAGSITFYPPVWNRRGCNKRGVGKIVYLQLCLVIFVPFASYITERMMWKLTLNHANIFSIQQTVGKMSDHELLSPDNSGSGWDNVLLTQKFNKRGVLQ